MRNLGHLSRPQPLLVRSSTHQSTKPVLDHDLESRGHMHVLENTLVIVCDRQWAHGLGVKQIVPGVKMKTCLKSPMFSYPGNQATRILEIDGLSQECNFWWMRNFLSLTPISCTISPCKTRPSRMPDIMNST